MKVRWVRLGLGKDQQEEDHIGRRLIQEETDLNEAFWEDIPKYCE